MNARELKHQHLLNTWTPIIHECKNSGMTVKDWCLENDVNEKQLKLVFVLLIIFKSLFINRFKVMRIKRSIWS